MRNALARDTYRTLLHPGVTITTQLTARFAFLLPRCPPASPCAFTPHAPITHHPTYLPATAVTRTLHRTPHAPTTARLPSTLPHHTHYRALLPHTRTRTYAPCTRRIPTRLTTLVYTVAHATPRTQRHLSARAGATPGALRGAGSSLVRLLPSPLHACRARAHTLYTVDWRHSNSRVRR